MSTNRNLIPKDFEPVEDYQKAISSLRRQTELSSNKFVDHVQRKNAAFQSNDFDVTVSRTYDRVGLSEGRTCKWCLARTGKNVPYDLAVKMGMFERHEGCHCEIEYNNHGEKTYQYRKGGESSSEYERIHIPKTGKNSPTHVNSELVNTQKYHQKFEGLTGHKNAEEALYNEGLKCLKDNNDTEYEYIAAFDMINGKQLAENTEAAKNKMPLCCGFSEKQRYMLEKKGGPLFEVIHNHPNSSQPSRDDIRVLFQRKNQKGSTIVCHNGDVYRLEKLKDFENVELFVEKVYSKNKLEYGAYGNERVESETTFQLIDALTRKGVLKYEKR